MKAALYEAWLLNAWGKALSSLLYLQFFGFCGTWSRPYTLHADWTPLSSLCWPRFLTDWHNSEKEKELVKKKTKKQKKKPKVITKSYFSDTCMFTEKTDVIWRWTFHQWVFFSSFLLPLRCKQVNTMKFFSFTHSLLMDYGGTWEWKCFRWLCWLFELIFIWL